jgi:outer membrane scaffolding protein for murein synthesis (MipA/OmpV family)
MKKFALTLAVIPLTFATSSHAQMPERMASDTAGTGYVGVSGVLMSEYFGSSEEDVQVLPYLSLDDVKGFDLFGTALTYRAFEIGTGEGLDKWSLRAGPRIAYQPGRNSEDSPTLNGFEDVDGSFPLGGYIRSTLGPVGLRLDVGQDIAGGHDGLTADASIGTFYRAGNFAIQPSATVSWADNKHNDSFFGVNVAQSAASGLDAYDAGAGVYSYSLGVLSWVEFKEKYALVFVGSYRWFTDEATNSPIFNAPDGTDNGVFASVSLVRKFDTTKW